MCMTNHPLDCKNNIGNAWTISQNIRMNIPLNYIHKINKLQLRRSTDPNDWRVIRRPGKQASLLSRKHGVHCTSTNTRTAFLGGNLKQKRLFWETALNFNIYSIFVNLKEFILLTFRNIRTKVSTSCDVSATTGDSILEVNCCPLWQWSLEIFNFKICTNITRCVVSVKYQF